ncbi:MAG: hypothetical protein RIC55_31100 [Pirellulaceae bacterium]
MTLADRQAESARKLIATAHLMWSPLVLLAALYVVVNPPYPPASTGLAPPPLAWAVWTTAIVYLAAAAACHARLALLARRSPQRLSPRGWWFPLAQAPLVALAAWCFFTGPVNAANLAGLGGTVAVTLVAGPFSIVLACAAILAARRTAGQQPDATAWRLSLLAALSALTTAGSLLVVQITTPAV